MNEWKLAACNTHRAPRRILWYAIRRTSNGTEYAKDKYGKIRTWTNRDDAFDWISRNGPAEFVETLDLEPVTA